VHGRVKRLTSSQIESARGLVKTSATSRVAMSTIAADIDALCGEEDVESGTLRGCGKVRSMRNPIG